MKTFVNLEAHNGMASANNRLVATPQGLVNQAINEKLRSVELEKRLLRRIEDVAFSRRYASTMREAMLLSQDFIAQVAKSV